MRRIWSRGRKQADMRIVVKVGGKESANDRLRHHIARG